MSSANISNFFNIQAGIKMGLISVGRMHGGTFDIGHSNIILGSFSGLFSEVTFN